MTPTRAPTLLLAALTASLASLAPARADDCDGDIAGRWRLVEGTLDGARTRGEWEVRAGAAPDAWEVEARVDLAGGPTAARWLGVLRRRGDDLTLEVPAARGLSDALGSWGAGPPALRGRYRRLGGALVGSWQRGGSTAREVLARVDGAACSGPRPAQPREPVEGSFGAGRDAWPQLNANDPEILTSLADERVLLVTTLSGAGRADPAAHLDHAFDRPFRIFVSNQNRTGARIWQVVALVNPEAAPVPVRVLALSSASTREAPYRDLAAGAPPSLVEDEPSAPRPSGPGEAAASAALRGRGAEPAARVVPGRGLVLLSVRPLEVREERMLHAELEPGGPVRAAVLYLPGPRPDAAAVGAALRRGRRVPRSAHDHEPTPLDATSGGRVFGRVAGVVAASEWRGRLTNDPGRSAYLTVPGDRRTFLWNAKHGAEGRAQSAPVVARLPSSAFRSWGNYGARFTIEADLRNPTPAAQRVRVFVDSEGAGPARALRQSFEVRIETPSGKGRCFVRVSQRMGAAGDRPLCEVVVPPGSYRKLALRAVYSANNTAPNPLRVEVSPAE